MSGWSHTLRVKDGEIVAKVRPDFLQRRDLIPLLFNVDTTTLEAAKESVGSVNELLIRLPALEATVADAAFSYYLFCVKSCKKVERKLPIISDANALIPFSNAHLSICLLNWN